MCFVLCVCLQQQQLSTKPSQPPPKPTIPKPRPPHDFGGPGSFGGPFGGPPRPGSTVDPSFGTPSPGMFGPSGAFGGAPSRPFDDSAMRAEMHRVRTEMGAEMHRAQTEMKNRPTDSFSDSFGFANRPPDLFGPTAPARPATDARPARAGAASPLQATDAFSDSFGFRESSRMV